MAAGDPILASDYAGIRRATIDLILVRLRQNAVQSVANATQTAVTFDTEDFDPYNLHSTASNTSRITPVNAGYYRFDGIVYLAGTTTGWDAGIWKNGTTQLPSGVRDMSGTAGTTGRSAGATVYCNGTTDYVELQTIQSSGAAVNTVVSLRFACFLECRFLGRVTNP